jgi:hypothetical protein
MLEFITRELKFKLDDKEMKMRFPSAKQMAEYSDNYDKNEDKYECIFSFLEKLGLEREVSESMEAGYLTQILKALTEEKK